MLDGYACCNVHLFCQALTFITSEIHVRAYERLLPSSLTYLIVESRMRSPFGTNKPQNYRIGNSFSNLTSY